MITDHYKLYCYVIYKIQRLQYKYFCNTVCHLKPVIYLGWEVVESA